MEFRTKMDEKYVLSLGRAQFIFSILEWHIVWLGEILGFGTHEFVRTGPPAGWIANHLRDHLDQQPVVLKDLDVLKTFAKRFKDQVDIRNTLIHAIACTGPDGEQILSYNGKDTYKIWLKDDVDQAAYAFETLSAEINQYMHSGPYLTYFLKVSTP